MVAPYVGAWIKTFKMRVERTMQKSHPTWVRGLKPQIRDFVGTDPTSHPTWVRGLKPSLPAGTLDVTMSHPTWVRGLKLPRVLLQLGNHCRTLRGCVD